MALSEPTFTIGIEEEYLLVDRQTRDLAKDPPASMLTECEQLIEGQVTPELLRSQIEVGTRVCTTVQEAKQDLAKLRSAIVEVAARYDLAPIAASTHPFAPWQEQLHTDKERYETITREMQQAARRMLICGMHVHVGIDDDALRIDLLDQFSYFLPHLLALSCSSPFWSGRDTGLKSYRLNVFDALPRTGLPGRFSSFADYKRHVDVLVDAGIIPDSSKLWWDVRPSARFPTLECRVMDVCTRLEDAACLAAVTVSLMRFLYRLRRDNMRWRRYAKMLINENRWRAMRYSYEEGLVDLAKGRIVSFRELFDEILELIGTDAEELGCLDELMHVNTILDRGTSAHEQIRRYQASIAKGDSQQKAMYHVVDFLIDATKPEA